MATDINFLKGKILGEKIALAELRESEEYRALDRVINDAKKRQVEMLASVLDSSSEYEEKRLAMLDWFRSSGSESYANIKAKYRVKNRVNPRRVLEVLGGDWGTFEELIEITQSRLKDFGDAQPDLKKDLKDCIEQSSKELVDIEVVFD